MGDNINFQIINNKSEIVFDTKFWSCVPEDEQLQKMREAGYKFLMGGKAISLNKIRELRENSKK